MVIKCLFVGARRKKIVRFVLKCCTFRFRDYILTTTLPSSSFSWNPSIKDATQKITALNKRVATYAKDRQIPFVDYYSNMVCISNGDQLSKYTNDGVHPNSQGYDVMESLIKPVIDKVLN